MIRRSAYLLLVGVGCCLYFGPRIVAQKKTPPQPASKVTTAVLETAETLSDEWIAHGRTLAETRFSPLTQINQTTVKNLGLAWTFDTRTTRGLEATPLVVDGVLYTTGSWSIVYALDAQSGKELWKFDPQVPREYGSKACCDVVNRGVALYRGKVFVGTLDGRLIALDAATGVRVWETVTVDQSKEYTITGAPRVVRGRIIIGNGGAEYGVRGYVSAYDAETGKLVWRFFTVPGDPSLPFESPAMSRAARTWSGEWWKVGGGGTVWDSMAYDPQLGLIYIGTGNGSPWNAQLRSKGGGDNLFLSSIVALHAETGEYVWHYQTTPGDSWDYTATQHMILADLVIAGTRRNVIMQAPKNGFFYVLDRRTGQLISAQPFAKVTWATGVDKDSGRPIETPGTRYEQAGVLQKPGPQGAHNWQPMSYNPQTGLVYIPAQDTSFYYSTLTNFQYRPGVWNTGVAFGVPPDGKREPLSGSLLAWDPIAQKERWRVALPVWWNGGTLSTAGGLVFQGTGDGRVVAYSAEKGDVLWEVKVGSGVIGSPVTYSIDGVQYVSIMAGWGGIGGIAGGSGRSGPPVTGRVLTFVLHGKRSLPDVRAERSIELTPIASTASAETVALGANLYAQNCAVCHGPEAQGGGGGVPDLRLSVPAVFESYRAILLEGTRTGGGMPSFKQLREPDVEAIRAFVISRRAELAPRR